MADTDVSSADVNEAALFIQTYLQEKFPGEDFTVGAPLYDFVIQPIAYVFAYSRKKATVLRNLQSLLTLQNLPAEESVSDAADAILANIFRTRGGGQNATGIGIIHLTQRADCLISKTTRFWRTQSLIFYIDSANDLFIPASQFTPNRGTDGNVIDYTAPVVLIAAATGSAYNVDPGRFTAFDKFSPFIAYVENTSAMGFGAPTQTTQDFIDKSRTAMSLRALVNARSNDATLTERYPAITKVVTVGYGDPEMVRDVVNEPTTTALHVGGHMDVYVQMSVQEITEIRTIAGLFPRPDNRVITFRDTTGARNYVTGFGLIGGQPVIPGDILFVGAGLPEAPFEYVIRAVRDTELDISLRTPFSIATDASLTAVPLTVSIGDNYPAFNNKLATTTSSSFATSSQFAESGRLALTGQPIYEVKRVEVLGASGALDAYKDPTTGNLLFTKRVNDPIITVPNPGDELSFRVVVKNPTENQSAIAVTVIEVGWPGVVLDGLSARVTYDTLANFSTVDAFVRGPSDRVAVANSLPRGLHPVYISFAVPYTLSIVSDPYRGNIVTPFDETAAATQLAGFIRDYRSLNPLDQSLLATQARLVATSIAAIYPFLVFFDLFGPDGRVFHFQTTARVTIFPTATNGVTLLNPTDFGLPSTGYETALAYLFRQMGISDRNIRYFANNAEITFEQRTS